jgi:hypothetical protein
VTFVLFVLPLVIIALAVIGFLATAPGDVDPSREEVRR